MCSFSNFYLTILLAIQLILLSTPLKGNDTKIKELKKAIADPNISETEKVDFINKLSYQYNSTNIDSAIYFAQQSLELAEQIPHSKGIAVSQQLMGIYCKNQYKYNEALAYYKKCLPYYQSLPDESDQAPLYENIAKLYRDMNTYDSAMSYYLLSLKIREAEQNQEQVAWIKNDMGILYKRMRNFEKALNLFQESLKIYEELSDTLWIAKVSNNIGNVHLVRREFDSSLSAYQRSLAHYNILEDTAGIMKVYTGLGRYYFLQSDFEQSKSYYQAILDYQLKNDDLKSLAYAYNNLSFTLYYLEDYEKALYYRRKALTLNQSLQEDDLSRVIYYGLSDIFKTLGMYDSAIYYNNKYELIENDLYNIKRDSMTAVVREAYEAGKRERQIELLQEQNIRKAQLMWAISLISALSIVLLISWLYNYRRKQKDQQQMIIQKEEIMNQKEEINRQVLIDLVKEQEIEIKDSMRIAEQQERNRIAHELHEGVQNHMAFSIISLEMMGKKLKEYLKSQHLWNDYLDSVNMIKHTKEDVRLLSHNLRSEESKIENWLSVVKKLCHFLDEKSHIRINFQSQNLKHVYILPDKERHIIRILQELFNNIVTHSKATEVTLDISHTDEMLILNLSDDGIGFDMNQTYEGVGIKHMRARAESMQGTFDIQSTPGEGTTVKLTVPVDRSPILA